MKKDRSGIIRDGRIIIGEEQAANRLLDGLDY